MCLAVEALAQGDGSVRRPGRDQVWQSKISVRGNRDELGELPHARDVEGQARTTGPSASLTVTAKALGYRAWDIRTRRVHDHRARLHHEIEILHRNGTEQRLVADEHGTDKTP